MLNVVAEAGAPATGEAAAAAEPPTLIDAKIGEINGRPIRVDDVLGRMADRLRASAQTRHLTRSEWRLLLFPRDPPQGVEDREISRGEWLAFASRLSQLLLNQELEDQLLAEEARSSLNEQQQQGLKYILQDLAENERRRQGGQAALESRLREKNLTEQDVRREAEAKLLIDYELQERLRRRVRTSWRDVRLYYEKHPEIYNPQPVAQFRMIAVPAERTEAIQKIQAALDSGESFAKAAAMPENAYRPAEGGKFPPQTFEGEYAEAKFFSDAATNDAAHALKPGGFTKTPFEQGKEKDKAWLFLESVERGDRPLSDKDVQLEIAGLLEGRALDEQKRAYLDRLKERASFTDVDSMAAMLAQIAAARYWPER
jgi:hypothetical protein